MKKILIRSGISPLENLSTFHIIHKNLIGSNSGNLIYAYSVYRALMTSPEVELIPDRYKLNEKDADWINETCSCYVIPLADMFRPNAEKELYRIANLVKKLKIPCIVIGVGLRASINANIDKGFKFDDVVKYFINSILEKSAMLGLRGENTGKYLKHLGYKEDKDFMVIGCPSMYTYGNKLKHSKLKLTENSKISVNASVLSETKVLNFLNKILDEYKNSFFVPQRISELKTLYLGEKYIHTQNKPMYPTKISDKIYQENRVKFFTHQNTWQNFLEQMDLSIGGRLHGNIAAILAGIPTIILPHDSRMSELVNYHHLPCITSDKLIATDSLPDILNKVDFSDMHNYHNENFNRYKKFLKLNNLNTIFENSDYIEQAPLDIALSKLKTPKDIESIVAISKSEIAFRKYNDNIYNICKKLLKKQ